MLDGQAGLAAAGVGCVGVASLLPNETRPAHAFRSIGGIALDTNRGSGPASDATSCAQELSTVRMSLPYCVMIVDRTLRPVPCECRTLEVEQLSAEDDDSIRTRLPCLLQSDAVSRVLVRLL